LIRDEKISALGNVDAEGETIDATGMYVFPGGIDPHVHLHYPQGPHRIYSADDWFTGTIAAGAWHQNVDYTPYEGWRVRGAPQTVLARGAVVVRDGNFGGAQGRGAYLARVW
jgi:dihydroorotase-like cyclic amidohydrolase